LNQAVAAISKAISFSIFGTCTLALARNAPTHARFLVNYSNEELLDLENQTQGSDS
jgi:hypothetical protein